MISIASELNCLVSVSHSALMGPIKTVAVVGTGPAGAIAVDALVQEKAFDVIRVFERREQAGGCW